MPFKSEWERTAIYERIIAGHETEALIVFGGRAGGLPVATHTRNGTVITRDADGNLVPAHFIETVTCFMNDEQVIQAQWGPAVSKNPFFSFQVKDAAAGDVVKVTWVDNLGETSTGEVVLK